MHAALAVLLVAVAGCGSEPTVPPPAALTDGLAPNDSVLAARLAQYATVRLAPDLSGLDDSTRTALAHLVAAARLMDGPFWVQTAGPRDSVLALAPTEAARRYAAVNYGPYDQLDGDAPFLPGVGARPSGANLYPPDLDADGLFQTADLYPERRLASPYTLVRREDGQLAGVPYRKAFAEAHGRAAAHLRRAAALVPDTAFAAYLRLRADGLLSDGYGPSDRAWAALRDNAVDIVIGPVETYADGLAGIKATHGAAVLVRDSTATARLRALARRLPDLRLSLPLADTSAAAPASLDVFDAAFLAGEANAGPKPVAFDLPNRPAVRAEGTRRLHLRNVARAKFDRVLAPIADAVLAPDQRALVMADVAFDHALLHDLAHVLAGVPEGGADALAEATAEALALWLVGALDARGAWDGAAPDAHAATFVTSAVRTVRFGAAGPRGRGALVVLDGLRRGGAVAPDTAAGPGVWRVVPEAVGPAVDALVRDLLAARTDAGAPARLVRQRGRMTPALSASLDRVETAGVPVDVVFEQGAGVLGLEPVPTPPPAARGARL